MFINDYVFDNGLVSINTDGDRLHLCSANPGGAYSTVTSTSLANAAPTISAPTNATGGGRAVVVSAISGGTITAEGTATHWAVVDVSATRVLASGSLSNSQILYTENTFDTTAFEIIIRDAA